MTFIGPVIDNPPRWTQIWTVDLRQLREVKPRKFEFEVLREFGYSTQPADDDTEGPFWLVSKVDYLVARTTRTDLASVPSFLWGVVASYGRQTLPAILHDIQCDDHKRPDLPGPYRRSARRQADGLFRATLGVAGAGPVRRWLMWTGVRLGGLRSLAIGFGVAMVLLLAALGDLIWWGGPAWAGWLAIAAAAVLLVSLVASSVESFVTRLDDGIRVPPGSVPPEGAADFGTPRFSADACRSAVGAVLLATVAALPILVVSLITLSTAWVMRRGERKLPATAGTPAYTRSSDEGPTARIQWTPRPAGDSPVDGNPPPAGF